LSAKSKVCGCGAKIERTSKSCKACYGKQFVEPATSSTIVVKDSAPAETSSAEIRKALAKPKTLDQLASALGKTQGQTLDALLALRQAGVNLHEINGHWSVEAAPEQGGGGKIEPYRSRKNGRYRFGWHGDSHLGSKYERLDVLRDIYRRFADADLDRIFHAGNWIDGEARFNKYDLKVHGMDAQVQYLVNEHPVAPNGIRIYSVAGDDHEGWYCQREGVDIGKYAENEMRTGGRSDWVNLGYMEAFVPLEHAESGKRQHLHIVHPGGGSSYATSYTVQKLVESYSGGSKPAVMLAGHYHKMEVINVRNVWCIQTGCTQDQTPFARKKRLHYVLGGGTCELEQDAESGAIVACTVQMFHYFDKGFYSDRWSMSGNVTLPNQAFGGVVSLGEGL
jgi:hypothetical protein